LASLSPFVYRGAEILVTVSGPLQRLFGGMGVAWKVQHIDRVAVVFAILANCDLVYGTLSSPTVLMRKLDAEERKVRMRGVQPDFPSEADGLEQSAAEIYQ
jgi:hypothetical protein